MRRMTSRHRDLHPVPHSAPARTTVARYLPILVAVAATSCGDDKPTAPDDRPTLVNRPPMLVTSARAGNFDVYVMEADGSGVRQVTDDARSDQQADWAPDGFRFAFMSNRDGDSGSSRATPPPTGSRAGRPTARACYSRRVETARSISS
jgi:hypothetical protein